MSKAETPFHHRTKTDYYSKYKRSNIFEPMPTSNAQTVGRKTAKKENTFVPKFKEMTAKERYLNDLQLNNNGKKFDNGLSKTTYVESSVTLPSERVIKQQQNPLNRRARAKSLYTKRSTIAAAKDDCSAQERKIDSNRSNIFFVNNKTNNDTNNRMAKRSYTTRVNNRHMENKSEPLTTKQLKEKANIKHSLYPTNTNWVNSNTEVIKKQDQSVKDFRRKNTFQKEMYNKKNTPTNDTESKSSRKIRTNYLNMESTNYDLISNKKSINKQKSSSNLNNAKKDSANPNPLNKVSTEYFEIDVPKEFNKTDLVGIKKIFADKGVHVYNVSAKPNVLNNKKGTISLRARRDNNDGSFEKAIEKVKKEIKNKEMTLKPLTERDAVMRTIPQVNTGEKKKRNATPGDRLKKNNILNSNKKVTCTRTKTDVTRVPYKTNYKNYTKETSGK